MRCSPCLGAERPCRGGILQAAQQCAGAWVVRTRGPGCPGRRARTGRTQTSRAPPRAWCTASSCTCCGSSGGSGGSAQPGLPAPHTVQGLPWACTAPAPHSRTLGSVWRQRVPCRTAEGAPGVLGVDDAEGQLLALVGAGPLQVARSGSLRRGGCSEVRAVRRRVSAAPVRASAGQCSPRARPSLAALGAPSARVTGCWPRPASARAVPSLPPPASSAQARPAAALAPPRCSPCCTAAAALLRLPCGVVLAQACLEAGGGAVVRCAGTCGQRRRTVQA